MSIFLGEEPAKRMSEWHSWETCGMPLKLSRKPALRPLNWLLLISVSHFSWNQCKQARTQSCAVTKTDWWPIPSCSMNCSWMLFSFNQTGVFSTEVGDYGAVSGRPTVETIVVKRGNNPLTYIMTTPNLDATQHHWVESLVGFTFSIEYHKGWDSAAADALSWVTLKLDTETVKSILDGVTMGNNRKSRCSWLSSGWGWWRDM